MRKRASQTLIKSNDFMLLLQKDFLQEMGESLPTTLDFLLKPD